MREFFKDIQFSPALAAGFVLMVLLPVAGMAGAGKFTVRLLEFPPLTRYVEHASFSLPVFCALAGLIAVVVLPFPVWVVSHCPEHLPRSEGHRFPRWGWAGLFLSAGAWFLAWTRFSWFESFQLFTFSPIWFGYILVVNGLTFRRTGHCMLRDSFGRWAGLFVVSAGFWWYFEFLNRFVQNWYYVGCDGLSPMEYFFFATLPFSTVLPAVMGTYELLASYPVLYGGLDDWVNIDVPMPRLAAGLVLLSSAAGLACIGLRPDVLFPLLWISPLVIISSIQCLRGRETVFTAAGAGDWRRIFLLALAALACGFFWEMWNWHSAAKWVYAVPYVNRFKIFEMPVLGYAGYLPFGLECAVIVELAGLWPGSLRVRS